mmetsp:Transcript_13544/g.20490  ORF Transcript_13544/g.20490 Transcript_13544/m.20490 type:complete len:760 (-) Transcript_13544:97-2376(-)
MGSEISYFDRQTHVLPQFEIPVKIDKSTPYLHVIYPSNLSHLQKQHPDLTHPSTKEYHIQNVQEKNKEEIEWTKEAISIVDRINKLLKLHKLYSIVARRKDENEIWLRGFLLPYDKDVINTLLEDIENTGATEIINMESVTVVSEDQLYWLSIEHQNEDQLNFLMNRIQYEKEELEDYGIYQEHSEKLHLIREPNTLTSHEDCLPLMVAVSTDDFLHCLDNAKVKYKYELFKHHHLLKAILMRFIFIAHAVDVNPENKKMYQINVEFIIQKLYELAPSHWDLVEVLFKPFEKDDYMSDFLKEYPLSKSTPFELCIQLKNVKILSYLLKVLNNITSLTYRVAKWKDPARIHEFVLDKHPQSAVDQNQYEKQQKQFALVQQWLSKGISTILHWPDEVVVSILSMVHSYGGSYFNFGIHKFFEDSILFDCIDRHQPQLLLFLLSYSSMLHLALKKNDQHQTILEKVLVVAPTWFQVIKVLSAIGGGTLLESLDEKNRTKYDNIVNVPTSKLVEYESSIHYDEILTKLSKEHTPSIQLVQSRIRSWIILNRQYKACMSLIRNVLSGMENHNASFMSRATFLFETKDQKSIESYLVCIKNIEANVHCSKTKSNYMTNDDLITHKQDIAAKLEHHYKENHNLVKRIIDKILLPGLIIFMSIHKQFEITETIDQFLPKQVFLNTISIEWQYWNDVQDADVQKFLSKHKNEIPFLKIVEFMFHPSNPIRLLEWSSVLILNSLFKNSSERNMDKVLPSILEESPENKD